MMASNLTEWFENSRDGRKVNKWDFVGLALVVIGVVWGLVGLIAAGYAGGFGFFAIGFLMLFRHHPGGA